MAPATCHPSKPTITCGRRPSSRAARPPARTWEAAPKPDAKLDAYATEVQAAFEAGELGSVASKEELEKLRAAVRATGTKDRRVNIRLASADVRDLQALALREGIPYQTLIASVVHEFVTRRLVERA